MSVPVAEDIHAAYSAVTPEIVEALRAIAGPSYVIYDDAERMADYAHDEVAGAEYAHRPDVVVRPGNAGEVAAILKLATRERIPVTPRGAGSGLSGGAVPVFGGIVLATDRMNRILEIDRANMVIVVEPGVVTNDINEAIKEYGLFYAGYPMSTETCYVGGNIAENAGGGRAIKYGVTGRYVLGLEVVLPTGEIVQMGGKRVKDVTGYDLVHLMVGSEGTLGVVTRIILKLVPLPVARAVILVPFPDVQTAIDAVPLIGTQGRVIPAAVEFMDALSVATTYKHLGEQPPARNIGAMLLIEVDGFSAGQVEEEYNAVIDLCLEHGALDAFVGDTPAKQRKMWKPRESLAEAFKVYSPVQSVEDIVVPTAAIPRLMPELQRLAEKYQIVIPCYGHAGDGNLHATPLKAPAMSLDEWHDLLPRLLEELYRAVAGLGGTISGEHGIGHKRSRYLPLVMEPEQIELQRRIKRAFDPNNILNPGKIFPPAAP
ncbi:MAG TPA: FAD-linked oxidase C-terminal domain-containing protein [Anaerolineae bacterium]